MSVSPNATNQRLPHIDALAEVCRQLRLIGVQSMEAKKDSPADFQRSLPDLLTQSNHLFVALKTLNRQTYNHTRATKQATTDAKLQMDRQQLGLQNFHYERRHLEKEIRKCEEFDSIYQDINLVPQEDFLTRAPAELTSTTDPHQLMINQLDFELSERLRLEKETSDLHELQSKLLNENKRAKAELESLDGELEQFLKGSIQLQEALKIPIDATRKKSDAARLLPMPLFVLFRHALGYSEAFDHTIIVDIQGDTIAAASFLQVQSTPTPSSSLAPQSQQALSVPPSASTASPLLTPRLTSIRDSAAQPSSDPGTPRPNHDRDDDDGGSTAKKHKARHGTMPADQYYKRHPLEVVITINKDGKYRFRILYLSILLARLYEEHTSTSILKVPSLPHTDTPQSHPILKLRFAYLPNLNIVTVAPEECAGILYLDKRDMLANLLPGDIGTDSPNPANQFLSDGDDPFEFDSVLANGHAYHWAQHMCGLDFASTPPQQQDVVGKWTADPGAPRRPYLAKLIELVRVRRRGWKQLERQLEALRMYDSF
ncbi:Fms-interacting protein-domain-containing protein [Endogone sp. FLAS-F59071]|nr:Fms-interacting protein-domain-containing protein [Endogone sp. FLAS-F59071]|eukprot:RUS18109.1 Fms-interacting protein-domain-containing protein [Endogone sp. FLAS-F59071]